MLKVRVEINEIESRWPIEESIKSKIDPWKRLVKLMKT